MKLFIFHPTSDKYFRHGVGIIERTKVKAIEKYKEISSSSEINNFVVKEYFLDAGTIIQPFGYDFSDLKVIQNE